MQRSGSKRHCSGLRPWRPRLEEREHRTFPSFLAPVAYDAGYKPVALAVTDVHRDGIPDVVTANFGQNGKGSVSVLLGNGDGSLQTPVVYSLGVDDCSVAVADLNGDTGPAGSVSPFGPGPGSFDQGA